MGIKAVQVPAMVAAHQSYLLTTTYEVFMGHMVLFDIELVLARLDRGMQKYLTESEFTTIRKIRDGSFSKEQTAYDLCRSEADRMNIATQYHISEQMTAVAVLAAAKLSEEEDRWNLEMLPSRTGILVFERPLVYLDGRGVQTCLAAMSWHVYIRHSTGVPTIEFTNYAPDSDPTDTYSSLGHLNLGPFHFVATGAVLMNDELGPMILDMADPDMLDEAALRAQGRDYPDVEGWPEKNMVSKAIKALAPAADALVSYPIVGLNTYRIMYAIFALMGQTVADVSIYTDRKMARRNRNRTNRPFPMVTVIKLRHAEEMGAYDSDGTWKLRYRSMTRAHWRRQHYADGSVRKIWIHQYWRGPENAPIHQPRRVTSLQR